MLNQSQSTLDDNLNSLADQSKKVEQAAPVAQPTVATPVAGTDAAPVTVPTVEPKPQPQAQPEPQIDTGDALKGVKGMSNIINAALNKGIIKASDSQKIKQATATTGESVEDYMLRNRIIDETDLAKLKSEMYALPYVDVREEEINKDIMKLIPQEEARKNMAVAFGTTTDGRVKLAMVEPLDIQKVRYLETIMGKKSEPMFATAAQINQVIDNEYGAQIGTEVSEALEDIGSDVIELSAISRVEDLSTDLASAPVSKIVNMVLEYAIKYKASDIHIEPREKKISVRFRIFGVLSEKLTIPKKLANSIVSRIKILSNLKIDEKRVPQDGRFQVKSRDKLIDVRVSVMPTVYGEKVVMRLLEKGGGTMDLKDTGLSGPGYKVYTDNLKKTEGILLITGPTGSGKTQTLASSLKILNKPEVNIMTVEDPVEIRIDGITQVQVNRDVELTFAKALRSFLRQDPDIIMVGEIRDSETANLAIQASLTGHLVLSTLHTNNAAGALPRLIDMGVEPYLLASTINVVIAQRLVRKICEHCKVSYPASTEVVKQIHQTLDGLKGFDLYSYPKNDAKNLQTIEDDVVTLYKGQGCARCNNSGYSGRIGIFETMLVSPTISKLMLQARPATDIEQQAVSEGMITIKQDGFMKSLEGITTLEEVLRVIN